MRRFAYVSALVLLCSACAEPRTRYPGDPYPRPPQVGVDVSATRGRCTNVVFGDLVRRVCAPRGRKPEAADTTAQDTTRQEPGGSRAAGDAGR